MAVSQHVGDEQGGPGWQARLSLAFERRAGQTTMVRREHCGPLQVQRPFRGEGGCCEVCILHPPGGVVGGDRLDLTVDAGAEAQVRMTTPAANKFYRSSGPVAVQRQLLRVADGALLEWLPQETIVYSGALVDSVTRIELEDGARFIGWEILCLGRPASGEAFAQGTARQDFEIWRNGRLIWVERGRYVSRESVMTARWGLAGLPVTATLVCAAPVLPDVEHFRRRTSVAEDGISCTVTRLSAVLVFRYLGWRADRAREALTDAWQTLRPAVGAGVARPPRIWSL